MTSIRIAAAFAALAGACALGQPAGAAVTFTGAGYSQNFNTLAATGTSVTTLPAGWEIAESGGGARDNEAYTADDGGSNTGDTYSYGTGAADRALGSLASGSLQSTFGAIFTNGTGGTITALRLDFFGEQWRYGGTAADKLTFEYSTGATSVGSATGWTAFSALDFNSLVNSGTAGALNGNAAANRTAIGATIGGLSILAGQSFGIRWSDADNVGGDDGMAIDDLTLTAPAAVAVVPEPASWAMMVGGFGLLGCALRRRRPATVLG